MERCFCGCGIRLLRKNERWVANQYGRNAANLSGTLSHALGGLYGDLGFLDVERRDLELLCLHVGAFADAYREVVHKDKPLSAMEPHYDEWIIARNAALSISMAIEDATAADPERSRTLALFAWAEDRGMSEAEGATALEAMPDEDVETIISRYEEKGAERRAKIDRAEIQRIVNAGPPSF